MRGGISSPAMSEKPQTRVTLPAYFIGRYPITNAQFAAFVAADGYRDERFWTEACAAHVWQAGQVKGVFDDSPRNGPFDFGEPFNLPNHPVVGVTWYETLAFTRWLTGQWQAQGILAGRLGNDVTQRSAMGEGRTRRFAHPGGAGRHYSPREIAPHA